MEKLIEARQHIAFVCSCGTITGIVTLEDIFEEMVGDIEEEYDLIKL